MQKSFLIAGCIALTLVAGVNAQQRPDRQQPRPTQGPVVDAPRPQPDQGTISRQGMPGSGVDPIFLAEACRSTSTVNRRITRTCSDGSRAVEEMRCTVTGVGGLFPNCIYEEDCEVTLSEQCPPAETETPDGD